MFILWVDSTKAESDTVRRAKLHMVDLAGSERISKTGVEGNLQREARYINLSLHYLEQVIVALHERSQGARAHVPYRNSMMTSVLRDSLGGNCKTVMVGAAAVEDNCIDETLSTCRFAQRVAAIKNNASINEELDPALLIKRLKREVSELKDELKLMSDCEDELTSGDRDECRRLVSSYLEEPDLEAPFVCGSVPRFRECFRLLRDVYWQRQSEGLAATPAVGAAVGRPAAEPQAAAGAAGEGLGSLEAAAAELRQQVAQRDQEIAMLVASLSRRGKREPQAAAKDGRVFIRGAPGPGRPGAAGGEALPVASGASLDTAAPYHAAASGFGAAVPNGSAEEPARGSTELLLDRNKAFEMFRKSVRRSETLEENKAIIHQLILEANSLGNRANGARTAISAAMSRVERARMERAMESGPRDLKAEDGAFPDPPEVVELLQEMEEQKRTYRQSTERLKGVKAELDRYKLAAEQNKERLQKDFEVWYVALRASQGGGLLPAPAHTSVPPDSTLVSPSPGPRPVEMAGSCTSTPSRASTADSSARGSSAPGARIARCKEAPVCRSPGPPPRLAPQAWSSPHERHASPVSTASTGVFTRPLSDAGSGLPPAAATTRPAAAALAPSPTPKFTGHAQTDSEIAAYFAAIADLQG